MYKTQCSGQIGIEGFRLPFSGRLDVQNRWVKLAGIMPWEMIERKYAENFSEGKSATPIPARIAFGSIYIKEQEGLTDRGTLTYIKENPYAQYFLGLEEFTEEALFDASMMVHFRKRFPAAVIYPLTIKNRIGFTRIFVVGWCGKIAGNLAVVKIFMCRTAAKRP